MGLLDQFRQTSGSVVCPSCGKLVGVNDAKCYNCGRRNPGMWGFAKALRQFGNDLGFVPIVMGSCILLYAACLIADPSALTTGGRGIFGFLSPSRPALIVFGASGPGPVVLADRWWTLLSAGWLHGSLLHIFFNLLWVRQLAPLVASLYGPARMVILYTVASVTGFLFSSFGLFAPNVIRFLMGNDGPRQFVAQTITVGASAAIFGLLGAIIHYGRKGSSELSSQAWTYAVVLFLFGLFMDGIDNWAHLGGFVGGYLMAYVLDPAKPERTDHLFAALLCLALTFAAVALSFFTGLDLVRG